MCYGIVIREFESFCPLRTFKTGMLFSDSPTTNAPNITDNKNKEQKYLITHFNSRSTKDQVKSYGSAMSFCVHIYCSLMRPKNLFGCREISRRCVFDKQGEENWSSICNQKLLGIVVVPPECMSIIDCINSRNWTADRISLKWKPFATEVNRYGLWSERFILFNAALIYLRGWECEVVYDEKTSDHWNNGFLLNVIIRRTLPQPSNMNIMREMCDSITKECNCVIHKTSDGICDGENTI